MTPQEVLAKLDEVNPDALLLEPRSVYDKALVDVTDDPQDQWIREEKVWVAVYDEFECIDAIMLWLGCPEDGALDWFISNTSGAWIGEGTPTFRRERERLLDLDGLDESGRRDFAQGDTP